MKFNINAVKVVEGQMDQHNPKDIFKILPKKEKKYAYLRDVQSEVLDKWFSIKENKEIVIKMNTGSGKTVVSLLILQSCLKLNYGPVVYVVPDQYLLTQVKNEANALGINITEDVDDISFKKQKSILLVNIHKIFNARSVFGVGAEGIKIDVGTMLIDDAHACIDRIEEIFTISIKNESESYTPIRDLFRHDLSNQSISIYSDIEANRPGVFMQVPFWSIQKHTKDITTILADYLYEDNLEWKLDLIKDKLQYCDVVVSSEKIEFSFRVIPIDIINCYPRSKKIIISATLPDDTILKRYLDISEDAIDKTITPNSASDLGERLIIVPEEINPKIEKNEIKTLLMEYAKTVKVVVIVPSSYRANYWKDIAVNTLYAKNINQGIEEYKKIKNGLIVLVNKYDGIDLPDDECRILVIDELPEDRTEIEKVDNNLLSSNQNTLLRKIRKIEQGMGRGIRSNDDYCVVFLLGKSLTNYLYSKNGIDLFTPATRKQIKIASDLLEQIHKGTIDDIRDAVDLLMKRDEEWVTVIKSALVGLTFQPQIPNKISYKLRDAYTAAWLGQYDKAISILEECCNTEPDKITKGWVKYYIAMFKNVIDPTEAQIILKSALSFNSKLIRPIEGIRFNKLQNIAGQAENCKNYLSQFSAHPNHLLVTVNSILEDLIFLPGTSERFEVAIKNIGALIGFGSQRPESDFGRGPDNLWTCGNLVFFVIECKNGCTSETKKINKHDTNQINGSIEWFESEFDSSCKQIPVIIHPYSDFEYAASPNKLVRIMNGKGLDNFKVALMDFSKACVQSGQVAELEKIKSLLVEYKLIPELIVNFFTISVA